MPLTPEDVRNKTFTPVRLREGYDTDEVDLFLDEVETELTRLLTENAALRESGGAAPETTRTDAPGAAPAESADQPPPEPPAPTPPVAPLPPVRTIGEASSAAARLLEIATTNADQLVTEAREESDRILGEARAKAERLESEARAKVEQQETDARTRVEQLDAETDERRHQMLGQLELDKESLTRHLDDLRAFEREYRSRVKAYLEGQLRALDGDTDGSVPLTPAVDGDTPRRLRELLGDDA